MRNRTLNNKGVALVTVVLFFLVLVILLGGVMFSSISNQNNAILSKEHSSAYYVAESGLNIAMEKLVYFLTVENDYSNIQVGDYLAMMNNLNDFLDNDLDKFMGSITGISPSGTYVIDVSEVIENELYTISSIGTVNEVTRTIVAEFEIERIEINLMKAVLAKNSIYMGNNAVIDGEIASLMEDGASIIDVSGCSIGVVYLPIGTPNIDEDDINDKKETCNKIEYFDHEVDFSDTIDFTPFNDSLETLIDVNSVNMGTYTVFAFPTLPSGKNGYRISSLPSTNMVFNLGSGSSSRVLELYVDNVTTKDGSFDVGDIQVVGDGKLAVIIKVDEDDTSKLKSNPNYQFTWDGNVNNGKIGIYDAVIKKYEVVINGNEVPLTEETDLSKFQLVVRKGTTSIGSTVWTDPVFRIPNNYVFIGSFLGDYVDIDMANLDYRGFLATLGESIKFSSTGEISGPMWIFAPNAVVNTTSGVVLNGAVMAKSVVMGNMNNNSSGGSIIYSQYSGDVPFEIKIPTFSGGELIPVGIKFEFINFKEV